MNQTWVKLLLDDLVSLVFWLITITATIVAFPKVLLRGQEKRARWISPDRGIR